MVISRTSRIAGVRHVAESLADPLEHSAACPAREREELAAPHECERGQDGQEAHGVDGKAGSDPGRRDHDAADRRPDDARGVEEARVERDGVRQFVPADELEVSAWRLGASKTAAAPPEQREDVERPELRLSNQDQDCKHRGDHHRNRLDEHHRPAVVETVRKDSGRKREDRERGEAEECEEPTATGECVSSTISQASATFCIQVPLSEMIWPAKYSR